MSRSRVAGHEATSEDLRICHGVKESKWAWCKRAVQHRHSAPASTAIGRPLGKCHKSRSGSEFNSAQLRSAHLTAPQHLRSESRSASHYTGFAAWNGARGRAKTPPVSSTSSLNADQDQRHDASGKCFHTEASTASRRRSYPSCLQSNLWFLEQPHDHSHEAWGKRRGSVLHTLPQTPPVALGHNFGF
ncbi:hypothetical protein CC86DRAFT_194956 [Ophiobolus disseminans]|uniref:Uncharacterized protein n=1 Tax=Ophiobolus disseminans TaxID=1469910 RepID=A0A6A7A5Y4_9PLEO|nr:hypothetical protein CC86DRAFT_194956 [Ophiobolus disseminans]